MVQRRAQEALGGEDQPPKERRRHDQASGRARSTVQEPVRPLHGEGEGREGSRRRGPEGDGQPQGADGQARHGARASRTGGTEREGQSGGAQGGVDREGGYHSEAGDGEEGARQENPRAGERAPRGARGESLPTSHMGPIHAGRGNRHAGANTRDTPVQVRRHE